MIALGTPIAYTHRAEVVRLRKEWEFQRKGGSAMLPSLNRHGDGYVITFVAPRIYNVPAEFALEPCESDNKSVIVWYEAGSGVVTGLVTKQIGKSVAGGGSTNMYGEGEWEPGWFVPRGKIELYTVRWELKGTDFIYVPTYAATPTVLKEAA